eukprot:TRINITY_DN7960_c0_g1_i1.p1 TRINITY_DN7960_c0_g1~~TRINITY_DN7960_c0_g1_i1.p1  ORF type:complete len:541 (-),score=52.41 TRINITY_DN7960_c0_g1_i1:43-1665(-)
MRVGGGGGKAGARDEQDEAERFFEASADVGAVDSDPELTLSSSDPGDGDALAKEHDDHNVGLHPVTNAMRTWHTKHYAALWVSLAANIPIYLLGSGLAAEGLPWWAATLLIAIGSCIITGLMVTIGVIGTKFGIPYPVYIRSVFGYYGAKGMALIRASMGCGWFAIQTWLGGDALYQVVVVFTGKNDYPSLGDWMGINIVQLLMFFVFWAVNILILFWGMEALRKLEYFSAPFLCGMGLALMIWAWVRVGSAWRILDQTENLGERTRSYPELVLFGINSTIGSWGAGLINIMDLTRFARSQVDQAVGQSIGVPVGIVFFSFMGIFVTSATKIIYHEVVWNPIDVVSRFESGAVIVFSMICFVLATLTTNVAANLVSPANDFANMWPEVISFRRGGVITAVIAIFLFPWKIVASPDAFIIKWLVGTATIVGAVIGVIIIDYFVLRKQKLDLIQLYDPNNKLYGRWNPSAFVCLVIALIPPLPGFIALFSSAVRSAVPTWITVWYDYSFFVAMVTAAATYWLWHKLHAMYYAPPTSLFAVTH